MDLSVIVVNFGVADYVRRCVASLLAERPIDARCGPIEIIVVDNFSTAEERQRVRALDGPSVRVLALDDNIGYAGALAAGLERAHGRRLAFLNPDTWVMPGALAAMADVFDRESGVGAVAPITWFDEDRTVMHPPHAMPGIANSTWRMAATRSRVARRCLDRLRLAFRWRYWLAREPIDVPMLTGSCILTSRSVVDLVGPPDPSYPLYFEDADWCRRVRDARLRLVAHPGSHVVHYYSVSTNRHRDEAARRHRVSRERYFRKWAGGAGWAFERWLERVAESNSAACRDQGGFEDLGDRVDTPRIALPGRGAARSLVEIAGEPSFELPAGAVVTSGALEFSTSTWRHLWPADYFVRSIDADSLRVTGRWRFRRADDPRMDEPAR
ncbi:MAG: glycosyltransferase family 2 protein [Planctomycetes bacterium]|nr:glycosyltransferase family 2 protein [Planctomycetota bacterium]MBI3848179.1 glycosyltransferase family 2 protein [Planctomycetota bacterium]